MRKLTTLSTVVAALMLAGCSSLVSDNRVSEPVVVQPNYPASLFSPQAVIAPDAIFALSPAQRETFLSYYYDEANQHLPGHMRLNEFLYSQTSDFSYKGQTFTAFETFSSREGNCMSLAILTTALARLVNTEIRYQKVSSTPVYHRHENVMTLSSHVRTELFDPDFQREEGMIIIGRPSVIIDYFRQAGDVRGNKIMPEQFIAMYFQNMAADALVSNELDLAHAYIREALNVAPGDPETLNTLAVLLNRKNRPDLAENIYADLLNSGTGTVTTLSNYALLKLRSGDKEAANAILASAENIEDDNPYQWLDLAKSQIDAENYALARRYYRRAADLAPYLAEAFSGLGAAYYLDGKPEKSAEYFMKARKLAYVGEDKALYNAKLVALKSSINNAKKRD